MSKRLDKLYKPCDQINKYDNEKYMENPLLKFHLNEIRERRHYTFLKQKAALVSCYYFSLLKFLDFKYFLIRRK